MAETDMSSGDSRPTGLAASSSVFGLFAEFDELDSLRGLTAIGEADGDEWYSEDMRIRRSRRHLVVGSSLLFSRLSGIFCCE